MFGAVAPIDAPDDKALSLELACAASELLRDFVLKT